MRYSRQELVIGKLGQKKLSKSSVAILGVGALGTVAGELLVRSGIGYLKLIDRDRVEETNLQRQLLFDEKDVGLPKAEAAAKKLKLINSRLKIKGVVADVNHRSIDALLKDANLILDCTDNLYTRYLLNEYTKKKKKPWVHAAAIGQEGNVMLITPKTPCFACVFGNKKSEETCDTSGVLNSTTTIIGALQAHLALTFLLGKVNAQRLIRLNLDTLKMNSFETRRNQKCSVCDGSFEYLSGVKKPKHLSYQCSDLYQFFIDGIDLDTLERKLKKIGKVKISQDALFFENLSIFSSGKVLVKAKSLTEAKSHVTRYMG